ncbi:MAG: hypothetical protein KF767_17185 [Bdellovibrionaceae bacterium]|nr:hypothetical protein [Pseudobdellovibrionaceae bacterium]
MSRKLRSGISVILMMSGLLIFFQNCSPPASIVAKAGSPGPSFALTD